MSKFNLDDYQNKVVYSESNNIAVVAGAGSGKTRVLTERIKYLLNNGVNPKSIVAFTFTKMAADELKQRLADVVGNDKMFIGTIHSYANYILRKFSNTQYELLTDELVTNVMLDLCKRNKILPITVDIYKDFISMPYDSGKVYDVILEKYGYKVMSALRHILEFEPNKEFPITIKGVARVNNYITFDELIAKATDYFNSTGDFVDYLFVDEFQDIGHLEYRFIKSLGALNNFIVGDDYQSIYGFKGSSFTYFQNIIKNENWKVYYLINNYRCGINILNYANKYIGYCETVIPKKSMSLTPYKGKYTTFNNIHSMIELINSKQLGDYKDWFILVRTNKELNNIFTILQSKNIPVITFKKSELTSDELSDLLNSDSVKLLTIHASKGLESKNVIVYYPKVNLFNKGKDSDTIYNDEELRVYYVACTRAKENLFVLP